MDENCEELDILRAKGWDELILLDYGLGGLYSSDLRPTRLNSTQRSNCDKTVNKTVE
jgi:hypothetical protein